MVHLSQILLILQVVCKGKVTETVHDSSLPPLSERRTSQMCHILQFIHGFSFSVGKTHSGLE